MWNEAKKADLALAWWGENSKCVYQEAFRDLDRALRDYIASRKGDRKGKRLGFPGFKKRGRCRDSFRFTTGAIRCAGTSATLPRIGTVKTHESTRKLARRLGNGPPASCRRPCPAPPSGGSCRSPSRWSGLFPAVTPDPDRASVSTSVGWPASTLAWRTSAPTPGIKPLGISPDGMPPWSWKT
jgi:hypothetical protein